MHSPYIYYNAAPSFTGRGRRFYRQNYMRGLNPRAGGIGGLVKAALVGTATYFVCKKIYQYVVVCFADVVLLNMRLTAAASSYSAGAQSNNNGQPSN
ncbi:hypothetical protein BDW60DRAFT_195970 [Aspergillus nidulans var. acristatus]